MTPTKLLLGQGMIVFAISLGGLLARDADGSAQSLAHHWVSAAFSSLAAVRLVVPLRPYAPEIFERAGHCRWQRSCCQPLGCHRALW